MTNGIQVLAGPAGEARLAELRRRLISLCGSPCAPARDIECRKLARAVHRVILTTDGGTRTFIVKRLRSGIAKRDKMIAGTLLPAVGLHGRGPPLLDSCPADESHTWHIYEDLGNTALDERIATPRQLETAIRLIATVHRKFASHPLLGQCRASGKDLSAQFFCVNIDDSIRALQSLDLRTTSMRNGGLNVRDSLLFRLQKLQREQRFRTARLTEYGGPETLLHGDLWPMNVLLTSGQTDAHARLIDWDHAGVGPPVYDLSNFLSRVSKKHRLWLLDIYRAEIECVWRLPDTGLLNELFNTCQYARLASVTLSPTLELIRTDEQWALDELREVDSWFEYIDSQFFGVDTRESKSAGAIQA